MDDSYQLYLDRLNVQDILYYAGYRQNKRDGLRYPSFSKVDDQGRRIRGEKFICMPGGKTCFKPPTIKSYNVISLIKSFPEMFAESSQGKSDSALVHAVCRSILNMPQEERPQHSVEPAKPQKPFDIKDYNTESFQKYNAESYRKFKPYFRDRGLSTETLRVFGKDLLLTEKKVESKDAKSFINLSFPLSIPGQKGIVGLEERGRARLDGSSGYKGKALGSNGSQGLWISSPNNTELKDAKHVLWFESGYDAMAFYQLLTGPKSNLSADDKKDIANAVFISTGGNPTVMQFRGVLKEAQNASHHLGFDNDMAGKQYVVNFETELRRLREDMPKVGEDMKQFMDSLKKPNDWLSGTPEYLPDELYDAYSAFFDASDELDSMKSSRPPYHPDDIKEQQAKVVELHHVFNEKMNEKLCIGSEQGHLKDLGTYDIPEWALYAMENGDFEGVTEEEHHAYREFFDQHFPEGFVYNIDWDNPNEFNVLPAFGTRNPNALTSHGESPYQAVKTYPVQFFHPTQREAYALPNIKVVREEPDEGCKDFNEQLKKQNEEERLAKEQEQEDDKVSAGIDMDCNGEIEVLESEEKKHHHGFSR